MTTGSSKDETLKLLITRRDEYKVAALTKKKEGDLAGAKHFFAVFKVIQCCSFRLSLPRTEFTFIITS